MDSDVPNLELVSSREDIARLQIDAITARARQVGRKLSIVEAGCGQGWLIDLSGVDYMLTGIDLDAKALELRMTQARDLDAGICGDICTLELPAGSFDVVYSFYVLEHIERADIALENLIKWLAPGGLLLLRLPDPRTVRGFMTRLLPHQTHVWYHRYVYQRPRAGQPGYAPYRVHYHPVIDRERLCKFLSSHGMKCLGCYGDGFRREGPNKHLSTIIKGFLHVVQALSFGRLSAAYADVLYVAVKGGSYGN
jgi:SAM-dependent methyltransferase